MWCEHSLSIERTIQHIVRCPAERCECTHCFAGNSALCQVHAFEVLTSCSTCIANLSFVCFICRKFIPNKILSSNIISCSFIYSAMGFLSFTSFCREQAKRSHCLFFCQACTFTSFCRAHNDIGTHFVVIQNNYKYPILLDYSH